MCLNVHKDPCCDVIQLPTMQNNTWFYCCRVSISYCLHTGIFRLDTCDLVVAGVRISISPKYLYLYLALKVLTIQLPTMQNNTWFYCCRVLTAVLDPAQDTVIKHTQLQLGTKSRLKQEIEEILRV